MSKEYVIVPLGLDAFLVQRTGELGREEYHINLRGKRLCDCPGFTYKKKCVHVRMVQAQLQDTGGMLDFQNRAEYMHVIRKERAKEARQ